MAVGSNPFQPQKMQHPIGMLSKKNIELSQERANKS
jgi:hypothetical protein